MAKPTAEFRVGQPVEYSSSEARCWYPAKIKSAKYDKQDGWMYEVSPDNLWCLESEIRVTKPPKAFTKKQAKKIPVGSWIRIWWEDSEPTVALLLDKINDFSYVHALYFNQKGGPESNNHADYDQIIEVIGHVTPPE